MSIRFLCVWTDFDQVVVSSRSLQTMEVVYRVVRALASTARRSSAYLWSMFRDVTTVENKQSKALGRILILNECVTPKSVYKDRLWWIRRHFADIRGKQQMGIIISTLFFDLLASTTNHASAMPSLQSLPLCHGVDS